MRRRIFLSTYVKISIRRRISRSFCKLASDKGYDRVSNVSRRVYVKPQCECIHNDSVSERRDNNNFSPTRILRVAISSFFMISTLSIAHMNFDCLICNNSSVILSSLGASCFVLCFNPRSSIAQPRNVIVGHMMGASCGVLCNSLSDLVQSIHNIDDNSQWMHYNDFLHSYLSVICPGPLAVSSACVLMMLTRTIHFPAAGTALGITQTPSATLLDVNMEDVLINPSIALCTLTDVFLSFSLLVSLACLLHRGSYPSNLK